MRGRVVRGLDCCVEHLSMVRGVSFDHIWDACFLPPANGYLPACNAGELKTTKNGIGNPTSLC